MYVTIKTPSRIHLGLIDLNGGLGRIYGSIGLALNSPSVVLEAKKSNGLHILGQNEARVKEIIGAFCRAYNIDSNVEVNVIQSIPEHFGLGSGTQLSLAVASALAHLHKLSADVRELARILGRGKISGIGIEAFRVGGFIIDGGIKANSRDQIPQSIHRVNFPRDWTLVLAIPSEGRGFFGEEEEAAFKKIIPAPADIPAEICRLIQMKMLPALAEKDISTFGKALMDIDKAVGRYFQGVQGGIYRNEITYELVECMLDSGAYGAGQSSWGPTVYALIDDEGAQHLESAVEAFMRERNCSCSIIRTHANNHGAMISVVEETE